MLRHFSGLYSLFSSPVIFLALFPLHVGTKNAEITLKNSKFSVKQPYSAKYYLKNGVIKWQ